MHLLLSIGILFGCTVVVVLGLLSVVADLLRLMMHRPPSV
jgi:hypothetical protein